MYRESGIFNSMVQYVMKDYSEPPHPLSRKSPCMNVPADKSTAAVRTSIYSYVAYLTHRDILCFFFGVKGVIPNGTAADM